MVFCAAGSPSSPEIASTLAASNSLKRSSVSSCWSMPVFWMPLSAADRDNRDKRSDERVWAAIEPARLRSSASSICRTALAFAVWKRPIKVVYSSKTVLAFSSVKVRCDWGTASLSWRTALSRDVASVNVAPNSRRTSADPPARLLANSFWARSVTLRACATLLTRASGMVFARPSSSRPVMLRSSRSAVM